MTTALLGDESADCQAVLLSEVLDLPPIPPPPRVQWQTILLMGCAVITSSAALLLIYLLLTADAP